ncbi:MAG: translocation/assembly module TamB [Magnetococcales bacterium]|nr:translocation/assembly module TamB [Magnetococcales bacterium]
MLKALMTLLLTICALLTGALLALQSAPVQSTLLAWLHTTPAMAWIRVQGIHLDLTQRIAVEQLELRDPDGVWLVVEQASITPFWPDLMRGMVRLGDVQARKIQALRIPRYPATPSSGTPSLPAPWIPTRFVLESIRMPHVQFAPELLQSLPPIWRQHLATLAIQADLTMDLTRESLALTTLTLQGEKFRLAGDLTVQPATPGTQVTLNLQASHITGAPPAWQPLLNGSLHGSMQARVHPDHTSIEIPNWSLTAPTWRVQGSGGVNRRDQTLHGQADLTLPDLAVLTDLVEHKIAGQARVTSRFSGPWNAPKITWQAEGSEVMVAEQSFKKVLMTGDLSDPGHTPHGHLEWKLVQPPGNLLVTTRYRLEPPGRIVLDDLHLTGPGTRLKGHLTGSSHPVRLSGQLQGEVEELAAWQPWTGHKLGGRLTVDLKLEPTPKAPVHGRLQWQAQNLTTPFGRLTSFQGEATGTPEQLIWSVAAQGAARWPYRMTAQGQFMHANQAIRIEWNQGQGELAQESWKIAKPLVIDLRGRQLEIKPWEITLGQTRLTGAWQQTGTRVEGWLKGHGDLGLFNRLFSWPVRGAMAWELRGSGHPDRPELSANLDLTRLHALTAQPTRMPPARVTLHAKAAPGQYPDLTLTARGLTSDETRATLTLPVRLMARAPWLVWKPEGALAGTLHSTLQLEELEPWLGLDAAHKIAGMVRLNLHASGTPNQPVLGGQATLEKGRYEHEEIGTSLHNMRARLRSAGESLILESLEATDGAKGQITAKGQMRLDPGQGWPATLQVQLTQAMIVQRDDAQIVLHGPLTINGTLAAMRVHGDLTLHRAELMPAIGTTSAITVVELDEPASVTSPLPSTTPRTIPIGLDLNVTIPGRAYLRGHGLDSEWMGAVRISGSSSQPKMVGRLQIKRGTLDLLERRLQLTSGAVTLDGAWPPDPWVEMEATLKRGELMTRVGLEGTIHHPKVKLTSEPLLSEEEILSHLLFDRTSDTITPTQALKLAWAIKSMQTNSIGILGRLQRELGIDRLDVTGDSAKTGAVSVGKHLTDKIYLEVEKGVKPDAGRINVEMELSPNMILKTGVDAKSNGDVGVQWKKDY